MNDGMNLPGIIDAILKDHPYEINHTGMSGSEVRVYDSYVLKIQKQSAETNQEYAIARWLEDKSKLPLPHIYAYCIEHDLAYTLMSRVEGEMLCRREYLNDPEWVIDKVAECLKMLWKVDVSECPIQGSRLEHRLEQAEYNVTHHLVDTENVEPETFGPEGFQTPGELLQWLRENRPSEDLVLTHGDLCLPNVIIQNGRIQGFIDLGRMGLADRWQDVAIAIRSLDHNFAGRYFDGKRIYDFQPRMLLERLGMELDEEKYRYYFLLDELF